MTRGEVRALYALTPLNGKLPIGPMPISPPMVSPVTLPVKASVNGIGLVMEIFQVTSSPLTVPSKIGPDWPSAPCVPVNVPPELCSVRSALRSPIGVFMVIFQFPSTDIVSPSVIVVASHIGMSQHEPDAQEVNSRYCDQARAARIRLGTRMRNATYCTANAASLAPTATAET